MNKDITSVLNLLILAVELGNKWQLMTQALRQQIKESGISDEDIDKILLDSKNTMSKIEERVAELNQ